MSQDVYFRLGERLNLYVVKMLLVDPFLDILRVSTGPCRPAFAFP
jgi:hypothetical protein